VQANRSSIHFEKTSPNRWFRVVLTARGEDLAHNQLGSVVVGAFEGQVLVQFHRRSGFQQALGMLRFLSNEVKLSCCQLAALH
jgi:hypothetical protein